MQGKLKTNLAFRLLKEAAASGDWEAKFIIKLLHKEASKEHELKDNNYICSVMFLCAQLSLLPADKEKYYDRFFYYSDKCRSDMQKKPKKPKAMKKRFELNKNIKLSVSL